MEYTVTIHRDGYTDYDGEHEAHDESIVIPFSLHDPVWYVYKRLNKYVVREFMVMSMWYTNVFGIKLSNGWCVDSDEFNRLFKYSELNKARELCCELNKLAKVKVIRM